MSNGITYTQIKGTLFNDYYRKDGPKVFVFSTSNGIGYGEYLKYDFSLKVGDTVRVIIHGLDTTLITVSSAGTKTFFGTERNYMSFLIDNLQSTGDGEETVVDGLGLVGYSGEVLSFGLSGAIINGVRFGQILDVDNSRKAVPDNFRLLQNFPNPFNPKTTIAFEINKAGEAKIFVYDLLGNKVASLLNEYKTVGIHQIMFDGSNLSSGIYFYQMAMNNEIFTKKFVLLK